MSQLFSKVLFFTLLIFIIQTQSTAGSKTIPTPDPSWDDYKVKSCCPQGFLQVSNYCVQCLAPNVFDSVDQRCRPCPVDHAYNNVTKSCDCKIPCQLPRVLNGNICECPADQKGNKRVWNQSDKSCGCPANLPLWNGKYCVACPTGTQFDPKEKQCYHCPDGFVRDYTSHACAPGL